MKNSFANYHSVEEFILDDEFFYMAKSSLLQDPEKREEFFNSRAAQKEWMQEAFYIINSIRIDRPFVSDIEIMTGLEGVKRNARVQKRKKRIFRLAAACVFLSLLIGGIWYQQNTDVLTEGYFLSQLEEIPVAEKDIQITVGKEHFFVSSDVSLIRQENGTLLIEEEETISVAFTEKDDIRISVPKGKRTNIRLQEGTKIWLNGGSSIIYPGTGKKGKREIYAKGEIFLDVAKDPERPFTVYTPSLQVEVLGTAFNVKCFEEDPYAEVVLVNGSVEITTDKKEKNLLLPDKCFHYENGQSSIYDVDVYEYIWWKDGIIRIEKANISDILNKLSVYYHVEIERPDSMPQNYYSGKFELGKTIEETLENLSLIEPIRYTKKENKIIIH